MAETIKGVGVMWGVKGLTFTGFGSGTGKTQSLGLNRGANKAEVQDESGDTVTQIFSDLRKGLSLSVVPTGTSVAAAGASLDAFMPAPGTTVTVVDSTNATVDGSQSGKYNLLSASLKKTNTGVSMIDIELEQLEANDVTVGVS